MKNIDSEYLNLLQDILENGTQKKDRTGTGTVALFGKQIEHDMSQGFPLLTTKKMFFKGGLTEVLWMLNGRTDIDFLNKNGVKYWNGDYERSGRTDGTLGKIYGYQWRNFNGEDQLLNLIRTIKSNPYSRRMVVSAWNPGDFDDMSLPPCHYTWQVFINNDTMDLIWVQRSVDVFLGLPFDITIYGIILQLLAHSFGYKPGKLIGQLGDCHLYSNHIEQAKEQLNRKPFALPDLEITDKIALREGANNFVYIPNFNKFKLTNYECHPRIEAPLSVGF